MQSSIAPTAALSAANGDERSLNINFNLHLILTNARNPVGMPLTKMKKE